MYYLLVLFDEE